MSSAKLLFEPLITTLAIANNSSLRFPVRRVFCVGKNYADHVKEMGGNTSKETPLFFTKPSDALVDISNGSSTVPLPPHSRLVHWETEFIVAIDKPGSFIPREKALEHIFGYAVGIDFTARDLQEVAKEKRRPWDMAKGYDCSGPVSAILNKAQFGAIGKQRLSLHVNGVIKQDTTLDQMIWSVPEIIASLSQQVALKQGDIIFTGTPSGVGQINPGDKIDAACDGLPSCKFIAGDYTK